MKIEINAFYKFIKLDQPAVLREKLLTLGNQLSIKGTILLAPEGINSTVSGTPESMAQFRKFLRSVPGLEDLVFKDTYWDRQAFKRYMVKLKKEIITFRGAPVDPLKRTGQYVKPKELDMWLNQEKENVIMIDTRNDFEFQVGSFEGAINPSIKNFSEFVTFTKNHKEEFANKKIVTFCTGGIRCEKATALMVEQGIENVFQIEGGILEYFRQTGGTHWNGACFVFDERVALGKDLKPVSNQ